MTSADRIYAFVFRGLLAKEAVLAAAKTAPQDGDEELDVGSLLAIDALDERFVTGAKRMSMVYVLIAAFENSVRELISFTLKEEIGEQWWEQCVSEKIRGGQITYGRGRKGSMAHPNAVLNRSTLRCYQIC